MARSLTELAALYAAQKEIERQIKGEELPPGTYDLSHIAVTVSLPPGLSVYRDDGTNKDGTKQVKATSNLYGFAAWAAFLKRLQAFNQANVIRNMIIEALTESIANNSTVETTLQEIDPQIAETVEMLKTTKLPTRTENTTRQINRPKDAVTTLIVTKVLQKALQKAG